MRVSAGVSFFREIVMSIDRRRFLHIAAAGSIAAAGLSSHSSPRAAVRSFKAIAFDAFPVFDPRPVGKLAEELFPGRGADLIDAWRTRQFEYQWLRTVSGRFADFWQTTQDGLVFAGKLLKLELTAEKRDRLMQAWLELKTWPEASDVLRALKAEGLRLAFVSNMTTKLLDTGIRNNGLDGVFEHVLSSDAVRAHKPDPRAYRMAETAFGLGREEILFAAFAGWDAAGARMFGYPTFWVNRLGLPAEELGVAADAIGRDLTDLQGFVAAKAG
jgi:2-haloacid dehalogenase